MDGDIIGSSMENKATCEGLQRVAVPHSLRLL